MVMIHPRMMVMGLSCKMRTKMQMQTMMNMIMIVIVVVKVTAVVIAVDTDMIGTGTRTRRKIPMPARATRARTRWNGRANDLSGHTRESEAPSLTLLKRGDKEEEEGVLPTARTLAGHGAGTGHTMKECVDE